MSRSNISLTVTRGLIVFLMGTGPLIQNNNYSTQSHYAQRKPDYSESELQQMLT